MYEARCSYRELKFTLARWCDGYGVDIAFLFPCLLFPGLLAVFQSEFAVGKLLHYQGNRLSCI